MATQDSLTIYNYHAECLDSFHRLVAAIKSHPPEAKNQIHLNDLLEELDKYKVWAGNVGAGNMGKYWTLSLDFRLQDAVFLKSQVIRLLESLSRSINKAASILEGRMTAFAESVSPVESQSLVDYASDAGSESDSPWEISDEGSNDENEDSETNRILKTNSGDPSTKVTPLRDVQFLTEMGQLFVSIKHAIVCLYKLPLRRPAPTDRLKGFTGLDMSLYQHFDILYVRDRFPNADEQLIERLGKLISRRRQLLNYRVTHTERLRPPLPRQQGAQARLEISSGVPGQTSSTEMLDNARTSQSLTEIHSVLTKATVQRTDLPVITADALYAPSISESRVSAVSVYTESQKLRVPPRPRGEDGKPLTQFECPYCGIVKHIPVEPARAWDSHVLRDLQPYVCTYEDCDMFDHMFESRDAWFNHESELHRAEWSCNTCAPPFNDHHSYLTFGTQKDFVRHMTQVHNLAESRLNWTLEAFRRPISIVSGECCLCGQYAEKLKSHLGRHMEQLALFALPRPLPAAAAESENAVSNLPHYSEDPASEEQSLSASDRVMNLPEEEASDTNETISEESASRATVPVDGEVVETDQYIDGIWYQVKPELARTVDDLRWAMEASEEERKSRVKLEEAIRVARKAVAATLSNPPDRAASLNSLSILLCDKFLLTHNPEDMNEAISICMQAVEATPDDHPEIAAMLNRLGSLLLRRFQHTGSMDDLTRAVEITNQAVLATPRDHPDRVQWLINLGVTLEHQYRLTGSMADLGRAIGVTTQALQLMPQDHPSRAALLSHLGTRLSRRFEHSRSIDDLDRAIEVSNQAVQAMSPDDPNQATILSLLGTRLGTRFEHTGSMDDLNRAVEVLYQAVKVTPQDHPDQDAWLKRLRHLRESQLERIRSLHDDSISGIDVIDRTAQAIPDSDRERASKRWVRYLMETQQILWHRHFEKLDAKLATVKIAVLDTGLQLPETVQHRYIQYGYVAADKCKSFYSMEHDASPWNRDEDGHGTHICQILHDVAPNAEIYIAKIFKSRNDFATQKGAAEVQQNAATAIRHASTVWRVDMILMSFGFDRPVSVINTAITEVLKLERPPLFFAATSDHGARMAWPASDPRVFGISSTDGDGAPSAFNSNDEDSYPILYAFGDGIRVFSPIGKQEKLKEPEVNLDKDHQEQGKPKEHYVSGASVAVPTAAGLAAILLGFVRIAVPACSEADRIKYANVPSDLQRFDGMLKVLQQRMSKTLVFKGTKSLLPWEFLHNSQVSNNGILSKVHETLNSIT